MHRTRFRPTCNGRLHIGGAYTARHCWEASRQLNGEFVLIEDDVAAISKYGSPEKAQRIIGQSFEEIRDLHVEDLEWLGFGPDAVHFASEFSEAHAQAAERLGLRPWKPEGIGLEPTHIAMVTGPGGLIPYHPWLVVGRVSDDHELGITAFHRGADLIWETQLYDYFARTLYGMGYEVRQSYQPCVVTHEEWDEYSKTNPVEERGEKGYSGDIRWLREIGLDGDWLHEVFLRGNWMRDKTSEENANLWQPVERIQATGEISIPPDLYAEIERCAEAYGRAAQTGG